MILLYTESVIYKIQYFFYMLVAPLFFQNKKYVTRTAPSKRKKLISYNVSQKWNIIFATKLIPSTLPSRPNMMIKLTANALFENGKDKKTNCSIKKILPQMCRKKIAINACQKRTTNVRRNKDYQKAIIYVELVRPDYG